VESGSAEVPAPPKVKISWREWIRKKLHIYFEGMWMLIEEYRLWEEEYYAREAVIYLSRYSR
jgi:hypothetical protein